MMALQRLVPVAVVLSLIVSGRAQNTTTLFRPAIFEGGFPGFVYSNATSNSTDEWSGMDVDIVRYLCNLTTPEGYPTWVSPGIESFLDCTDLDQAVITTSLEERLQVVIDGDADFSIGAISWTPERAKRVDFIRPFYFATGTKLLGLGNSTWDWKDLKGKTLCAYPGYHATQALTDIYAIKGYVEVSGNAEAILKIQNGDCVGMLVDGDAGAPKAPLKVISKVTAEVGSSPYGIVVKKNAPSNLVESLTAAAVSMLWSGRISPMWSIANDTFTLPDGRESVVNVSEALQFPTSAITGFLTRNGNSLDWSTAPIVEGSRAVPPPGNPINVTIVVYKGNALPLADIEGDISFLESGSLWKGIEIEMLKVMCSSDIIQCTNVRIAETVDERLELLSNGEGDISIGSIVVTQARLSEAYFVQPYYFSAGPALYVPEGERASIPENATLDYMNGKDVCTVTNSAQNPAGEKYGANLISFDTRAEAEMATFNGECIGLLWVSHVQFDGLIEVATDTTMDDPIGIAVRPGLPVGVYSYISALSSQFMSNGLNSKLLEWEDEYRGSATPNNILRAVTDAITNFEPSYVTSSAIPAEDMAPVSEQQQPEEQSPGISSSDSLSLAAHVLFGIIQMLLL